MNLSFIEASYWVATLASVSRAALGEYDLLTFQRGSQPHVALLDVLRGAGIEPARVHAISSISALMQVTSRLPRVHGAPVHIGDPLLLGIQDVCQPDYGDPIEPAPDELPLFWACGVTPQAALARARPSLCITHSPGAMLIKDLENARLASS